MGMKLNQEAWVQACRRLLGVSLLQKAAGNRLVGRQAGGDRLILPPEHRRTHLPRMALTLNITISIHPKLLPGSRGSRAIQRASEGSRQGGSSVVP